jgi:mono/diheme cytochrome c family protein
MSLSARLVERLGMTLEGCLLVAVGLTAFGISPVCAAVASAAQIERGRYLAIAGDCTGCHTRKGGAPFSGGLAIATPFGTIYSPNLTPDIETGLGKWTEENFYRAMHEGIDEEGARLYPAFPYPYYTGLSRADTDAIKAFLQALPPVNYQPPANRLHFPLNHRSLMRAWNALFFKAGVIRGTPASDQGERGRFLVETLGHCGDCHTPKNRLGGERESMHLGGGEIDNWTANNLTADPRSGLLSWQESEIVEYLKTGRNSHALATGPMSDVIQNSTSQLDDADLLAMAVYLKSVAAGGHDAPQLSKLSASVQRAGNAIFDDECSACHRSNGEALPRAFAPLKGSASVQAKLPTSVIRVILQGARAATTDRSPTPFSMPTFDWKLSDQEVADVATYIRNAWGNAAIPVSAAEVKALRAKVAAEPPQ